MSFRPQTTTATLQVGNTLQRSVSRVSARRPSVQTLPRVDEYKPVQNIQPTTLEPAHIFPESTHNSTTDRHVARSIRTYSQTDPWAQFSTAAPSTSPKAPSNPSPKSADDTLADISYAGWMKKRKTKMLRHEWHEHHFTLQGTLWPAAAS
ncbi:SAM and PH domain-containing protein [Rutstroemia sp. NJR-2017a BBW]|nr:SAM and PH domain-containing protein [Rutstroemia sp. NJR-2017a BBW]